MYYLKKLGFLEGEAGNYSLTELGKKYAEIKTWDNGYGGYAARGYEYYAWDKKIISKLDTTSEHLDKIRNLTKQLRIERKLQAQKNIEIPNPELLNKQNLNTANNKSVYIISGIAVTAVLVIAGFCIYKAIKNKEKNKNIVICE